MKNLKYIIGFVVVIVILVVVGLVEKETVEITSFEGCQKAGYPIMESYPEQCSDGINTFTRELTDEERARMNPILDEGWLVDSYLRENIAELSPVDPVLGGQWQVEEMEMDLDNNQGQVTYGDGHIQEQRNFSYDFDEENGLQNLVIE